MKNIKKDVSKGDIQWKASKPVVQTWTRSFKNKKDAEAWIKKK